MRTDDLTGPIRTRGPLRLGVGREPPASRSKRALPLGTRGPVRGVPSAPSEPDADLAELLTELRQAAGEMPLTILLHGSGGSAWLEFLCALQPRLRRDDSLWLVLSGSQGVAPAAGFDDMVTLDLTMETDRRIYTNLVCDLVFFPATDAAEFAPVLGFERRTAALVIDAGGDVAEPMTKLGRGVGLRAFSWRRGEVAADAAPL